jgi:hypothetical protein
LAVVVVEVVGAVVLYQQTDKAALVAVAVVKILKRSQSHK